MDHPKSQSKRFKKIMKQYTQTQPSEDQPPYQSNLSMKHRLPNESQGSQYSE